MLVDRTEQTKSNAQSVSGHILPYYGGVHIRYRVPRTLLQAQHRQTSTEHRLIAACNETSVLPGQGGGSC